MRKQLAKYESEAKHIEPFELELAPGDVVSIPQPDAAALFAMEGATSSRQILDIICGEESSQRLRDAVAKKPASVLRDIVEDIRDHFGLGE